MVRYRLIDIKAIESEFRFIFILSTVFFNHFGSLSKMLKGKSTQNVKI